MPALVETTRVDPTTKPLGVDLRRQLWSMPNWCQEGKVSMQGTHGKLHLETNAHRWWTKLWSHWGNLLMMTFYKYYILLHYGHLATRCGNDSAREIIMQLQLSEQQNITVPHFTMRVKATNSLVRCRVKLQTLTTCRHLAPDIVRWQLLFVAKRQ